MSGGTWLSLAFDSHEKDSEWSIQTRTIQTLRVIAAWFLISHCAFIDS